MDRSNPSSWAPPAVLLLMVIGPARELPAQDVPAVVDLPRALDHYERVEQELRAADVSGLGAEQRHRRARLLDELREYRERAVFGVNRDHPGERVPYFVDAEGRRCAVANLLDATGHGALTREVAATANHAWVADLAGHASFLDWLDDHGLTLVEAARIQAPGGPVGPPPRVFEPPEDPPVYDGPVTPAPASPASPRPRPDAPSGAPGRSGTPATATPSRSPRRRVPITALDGVTWRQWWHWNRRVHLPLPARTSSRPRTGTSALEPIDVLRGEALEQLRRERVHADARVRGAAVLALGRLGADAGDILPCFDDPAAEVRANAILALGASRRTVALHQLLHLAHRGKTPDGENVGAWSRPLAVLALGLADPAGRRAAPVVLERMESAAGGAFETDLVAASAFARLTGTRELFAPARRQVRDREAPAPARARAASALVRAADAPSVAGLTDAVSTRSVDVRRSAALALGRVDNHLALPALMTAFEFENEYLTRAFLLVAIGRQGGDPAREFLLREVRDGRKSLRGWAALGLGLLCRRDPRPEVVEALRFGLRGERNHDRVGAWLLALGLTRDAAAVDAAVAILEDDAGAGQRAAAVEALGLAGGIRARGILRSRVADDACPHVRGVAAEALGRIGEGRDRDRLLGRFDAESEPGLLRRIARGLGALGDAGTVRALLDRNARPGIDGGRRVALIEGLGRALARHRNGGLTRSGADVNFTLFPAWYAWALERDL